MEDMFSGKAAREFSREGRIEEWIHSFLNAEGNNVELSEGLKREKRAYFGPLRMPLHLFERCCGPEENMKFVIDEEGFESRVAEIRKRLETSWNMPPLIINFSGNTFTLTDGNHRYEAMTRMGVAGCDVIVWTTGKKDYQQFLNSYSSYL